MKWLALGLGIVFNALANVLMKAAAQHGGVLGGASGMSGASPGLGAGRRGRGCEPLGIRRAGGRGAFPGDECVSSGGDRQFCAGSRSLHFCVDAVSAECGVSDDDEPGAGACRPGVHGGLSGAIHLVEDGGDAADLGRGDLRGPG
nr:hypothetical protein [Kyrpidia spormannii]